MTDAELIAALRDDFDMHGDALSDVAADRIKALGREIVELKDKLMRKCNQYQTMKSRALGSEKRISEWGRDIVSFANHHLERGDAAEQRANAAESEVQRLTEILNTPEISSFIKGVELEAAHQRERWGEEHDAAKDAPDWFWTIGYLAGKALAAWKQGDKDKMLHHIITTAAACANWHRIALAQTAGQTDGEE